MYKVVRFPWKHPNTFTRKNRTVLRMKTALFFGACLTRLFPFVPLVSMFGNVYGDTVSFVHWLATIDTYHRSHGLGVTVTYLFKPNYYGVDGIERVRVRKTYPPHTHPHPRLFSCELKVQLRGVFNRKQSFS